jgi:hypothetical protein
MRLEVKLFGLGGQSTLDDVRLSVSASPNLLHGIDVGEIFVCYCF